MSTAPVTADQLTDVSYTPSQSTSNTPPGPTGVTAPPDQQPQPQAAQPTQMPPSPDQGGPVPQTSVDMTSNTRGWRSILMGALSGLAQHVEGAGKGLITGGIPGAVVGAVNPTMADNAMKFRAAIQQSQVQRAQAQAQTAVEQARFGAQNDQIQLAQAQLNLQHLTSLYNSTSPEFQQRLLGEGIEAGANLQRQGIQPVFVGDEADAAAHTQARIQTNSDAPLNTVMLPSPGGKFSVYEIPSDAKTYNHPVEVTIGHTADGQPIKQTFQPGQISIARSLALETAAMIDQSKTDAKVQLQNVKNQGSANVANIRANASAAAASSKPQQLMEGTDASGNQIAGTPDELKAAGVSQFVKMPALTQTQTLAARELTAPDGLFATARNQIMDLQQKGKLGPVASRWNNFWAGQGLDGDQQAFRGTLGLIATKLMQAHMGNRGGKDAMEHFASLVPENSTPSALMTELNNEWQYVSSLAKRPKAVNRGK